MDFDVIAHVTIDNEHSIGPSYAKINFSLEKIHRIKLLQKAVKELNVFEIYEVDSHPDFYSETDSEDEAIEVDNSCGYLTDNGYDTHSLKMVVNDTHVYWTGYCDEGVIETESYDEEYVNTVERVLRLVESGGNETISSMIDELFGRDNSEAEQYILMTRKNEFQSIRGSFTDTKEPLEKLKFIYPNATFHIINIFEDGSVTKEEVKNEEISDPD